MSITIGKRSFNNAISEFSHERFLQHQFDFRRSKQNLTTETSFDSQQMIKQKNLTKLESLFPNKTKNVHNFMEILTKNLLKGINATY